MEIKKFEIDFVERTKDILLNYKGPHDMSIIINCSLGLIVLPYENIKHAPSSFWDTDLNRIPNLPRFRLLLFKPIKGIKKGVITPYPETLNVFLKKVRNGLVHQHLVPVNENGSFVGVIIRNYFNDAKAHQDLEVYFKQQELKEFALFIADEYLK